jgi:hypothetical protein|nr:MAG TPA: hypothetical protein [Caudoviricetes sp.]
MNPLASIFICMKITYDPEKFGDLKPGDDVQLMGVGVVSDDGKSIEIVSIEDQEIGDDDSDDEDETEGETESPKQETETEEAEELAEGADIGSIIASGFGA